MSPPQLDRVVLIDDDHFDNKYHTRVIRRTGLVREVVSFDMAEDALDWFRREGLEAADLIFLDINMPRMDGFELLEAARDTFGDAFARMTVVMLTTSMDARDRNRAQGFPVVRRFVQKSLDGETLVELVETLLAERRGAASLDA